MMQDSQYFRQPDSRPVTEVVAAVIFRADGRFLLSSRPQGKAYAGYWEFAGGKVEQGEAPFAALQRELAEELGITVRRAMPWLVQVYHYEHAHVRITFFRIAANDWFGELQAKEGQAWSWELPGAVRVSPLLPANTPILAALAVPTRWRGNGCDGLVATDTAYRVLPEKLAERTTEHIVFDEADNMPSGEPFQHWLRVNNADQLVQAANKQAVALWCVSDETQAQAVCAALAGGVRVPLVVHAAAVWLTRYESVWLAGGAHAVIERQTGELG